MNEKLKEKTREALTSVLPITVIVLMLSVTLVPREISPMVASRSTSATARLSLITSFVVSLPPVNT